MKTLNRRDFPGAQYPERIIQFGEGNFLRAFVDWQIDLLNEHTNLNSGVVVVRPIETSFPPSLSTQDGLYTTIIRGLNEKGEAVSDARLIRSVNREISVYSEYDEFLKLAHNPEMRFVFSNTTEAGISYHAGDKFDDAPAVSYPAKLTRLLFERFSHFNGALDKGWIIIPCELIDYNGDALRELVLRYAQEWALPEAFIQWLDQANSFCSTLVDRIVTGYPRDEVAKLEEELGYHDGFLDTAEHFYLFVIQGPKSLATELRLDKYPLNVLIVDDIKPYKERKVAILNGAHTALVPVAFQAGLDTVGEAMNDAEICAFVEKAIYEEIIPVLDLPRDELESFASAVTGRFRNPYILFSIAVIFMLPWYTHLGIKFTLAPFSILGVAIAIFLGFRNNAGYARYVEARKLWGQLMIASRSLLREVKTTLPDSASVREFARLQIAFAHCLRMTLRKQPQAEVLAHYLKTEDLQRVLASNSPANHILLIMGEWLAVQRRNGQLSDILFISLNDRLNDISAVLAGCERIAYTPIPFAYTLILHRTVYLFCIMLPFALVVDLHYMTPFISVLISYTFISLDCLAEELEDPFGNENNDLPLDAICNAIEIDLLQMNDEAEIPAKILPDRHYQLT